MRSEAQQSRDYERIERAIGFIAENQRSQPDLNEIAASAGLSRHHFDRLFRRWAGVSPMRFLGLLTLAHAKQRLADSESVLGAALDAGLSGPGRLHDLFVKIDAVTPGEFKRQGRGLEIAYGFGPSPFGDCLLATTPRGICHLGFAPEGGEPEALERLQRLWPGAALFERPRTVLPILRRVFRRGAGSEDRPFTLHLGGTNLQVNVWRALLAIPEGAVVSYGDLAEHLGRPTGARAVAGAVAANPVGYLIPCHRVIARTGDVQGYRWGKARKRALLGWEAAQMT